MTIQKVVTIPDDMDRLRKLLKKMPGNKKPIAEKLLLEIEFMFETSISQQQAEAEGPTRANRAREEHPAVNLYSLIHRYAKKEAVRPCRKNNPEEDPLTKFVAGGKMNYVLEYWDDSGR